MLKKISVIIPCHNQGEYLENACNSIINQDYENWEVIIVDDSSTDKTKEIAKEIVLKDSRFTYMYSENKSSSKSRNDGLKIAAGDYIQFLDADDIINSNKFSESLKVTNQADIVLTNFHLFEDDVLSRIPPYCDLSTVTFDYLNILTKWDVDFSIPIHCALFKKEIVNELLFNTELKAKEDWVFWLAVFNRNPMVKFIDKELAFYRLHANSKTQNKKEFYNKAITTVKHIYSTLDLSDAKLFSNRLIEDLYHEKDKADYLYKLKLENDIELKNNKEELECNQKQLQSNKFEILSNLESISKKEAQMRRLKKAITYKTLVKLELFIRGIKKIK